MASRLLPMYNIDKAVGLSRPNKSDDVRLIQSLFDSLGRLNDPYMEGCIPVPVTGSYTPALSTLIRNYQKNLKESSYKYVVDGIIDPLPANSKHTEDWDEQYAGGATSTLVTMNYRLFRINKGVYFSLGDRLSLPWKPDPFQIS